MKTIQKLAAAIAFAALMPVAAQAATVYDNAAVPVNGDCSFSTTCAAAVGRTGDYAAQQFSLGSATTLMAASFSEWDYGQFPTAANWMILQANGAGGLPGTLIASGSSNILASPTINSFSGYNISQNFFNLGAVSLAAGSYYFAIQAVSPVFETYLGQGAAGSGAAESFNGGSSWQGGYEGMPSVAVALYDKPFGAVGVPEPATWAMMLLGFGAIGTLLRSDRRRALATA